MSEVVPLDALPEGWARTRLTDVAEVNPPKPAADALAADALVSFVPMPAVDADAGAITAAGERPFGEVRKGYTAFADGDVLLAKITPCFENGKAAVASGLRNGMGFGSSEFHVLRSRGAVLPEYLYHFVRQPAFREVGAENMTGTAGQARVPVEYVRAIDLPVPPLAEQQRIVAAVDAMLAQVSAVQERVAGVRRIVERFRRVVLAAALSAHSPERWDRDTTNVDGLASRVAAERAFGEITVNHDGRRIPIKLSDRAVRQGAFPYYGASGVIDTIDDHLFDGEFLLISEDGANLLSRSTPIAFRAVGKFWVNNHAHVVQPRDGVRLRFLELFLNSLDLQSYVTGTAQPKLTQAALNSIPVRVPSIADQDEVVQRVEYASTLADAVDHRSTTALAYIDKLPQAILRKAFTGQLVPTEAELARAEGRDYESADELLARVSAPATKPTRRRARAASTAV